MLLIMVFSVKPFKVYWRKKNYFIMMLYDEQKSRTDSTNNTSKACQKIKILWDAYHRIKTHYVRIQSCFLVVIIINHQLIRIKV